MRCHDCGFDDSLPIAEIMGFKKVWPHERAEVISDPRLRASSVVTLNGVLQAYHVGHLSGAIKCKIAPDGWMYSVGVPMPQKIVWSN